MDGDFRLQRPDRPAVVLDSNILIAYALLGAEVPRRSLAIADSVALSMEHCRVLLSPATRLEVVEVLERKDFDRYKHRDLRMASLSAVLDRAEMLVPTSIVRQCRDPEDDMFLELALDGNAQWLVSVDHQLLAVRRIGNAEILRPERFLQRLEAMGIIP